MKKKIFAILALIAISLPALAWADSGTFRFNVAYTNNVDGEILPRRL